MKNMINEDNPYLVKNKRFRRTQYDNQLIQSSIEKVNGLPTIKSATDLRPIFIEGQILPFQNKSKNDFLLKRASKQSHASKLNKSIQKRQIKFKKQNNRLEQSESEKKLIRLIQQKDERIQQLETILNRKEAENKNLYHKLQVLQNIQLAKHQLQLRMKDQLSKMQYTCDQEVYKLKQTIKKLEIDVNFTNRKWALDYERMLKQKQLQCKVLREKYTNILRMKRKASKKGSIITQYHSTTNQSESSHQDYELLDFSSFELSKDSNLNNS